MKDEVSAKLHTKQLYDPMEQDITAVQTEAMELLYDYNQTRPKEEERRQELLRKMLWECGEGCHIEPPFHANWGGKFLHLGEGVYANFSLTLVDDTHIYIGDHTLLGANVTIVTANHPMEPAIRSAGWQYNLPVRIGKNCWLGSGVTVLAGVTIGDNTVIGAGSVVTKDIPDNVLAYGTPCRVIRTIGEDDRNCYRRGMPIPDSVKEKFGIR